MLARVSQSAVVELECLSARGARVLGHLNLVRGESIKMMIDLEGHPLAISAHVLRVEPGPDGRDRYAVAFRDVPSIVQGWIDRFVSRSMERQRLK